MAYCLLADVSGMNATRTAYSGTTKPTSTQVQGFIDGVAGEIDTALASRAVLTPVTTPASFVAFLVRLNALGAAAQAEDAAFPEFDSQTPGMSPHSMRLYRMYQAGLNSLKDGSAIDPAAPVSASDPLARSYLTDNPDNGGLDGSDGFVGGNWGEGQQPYFSMQKVF